MFKKKTATFFFSIWISEEAWKKIKAEDNLVTIILKVLLFPYTVLAPDNIQFIFI